MPGWIRNAFNKEPAMMISGVIAAVAIAVPYVVVPIRRKLGLPTYQWDADPATHPYINNFGDNYKPQSFSDPKMLSEWSQHGTYAYKSKPVEKKEHDFPEARERLRAKHQL